QWLHRASQKNPKPIKGAIQIIQITGNLSFNPTSEGGEDLMRNEKFKILVDVWERIHERFVYKDKINDDQIIYGAIRGMTQELNDKYTVFQEPQEATNFNEALNGEFEGIGISIDMIDEKVTVISPLRKSPAERAGIHPNDVITKVGEKSVIGLKLEEVVKLIKGPKNTKVTLGISREGKNLSFEITRETIKMLIVDGYMRDGIAVIQINSFNQDTDQDFTKTVQTLLEQKPKGFIIDVRSNPGGFLDTALNILDHFIPKGGTISTLEFKNAKSAEKTFRENASTPGRSDMPNPLKVRYISLGKGELSVYPIIVIQNRGSASASEILAAALRDNSIATIIGDDSFGKGSVQELNNYIDGSQIKISIAKWLTPKGTNLTENPIKPDQYVKDDTKTDADEVLDAAIGMLK
ncbi:MAG: S41 family peptidase, partial [Patescibacteria group bacterium]